MSLLDFTRLEDRLTQALAYRHNGGGELIVAWAEEALATGTESASLALLAGLDGKDTQEVDQYLTVTLAELGIALPSPAEALRAYARLIARRALDGEILLDLALGELLRLWRISRDYDLVRFDQLQETFELEDQGYPQPPDRCEAIRDELRRLLVATKK